MDTIKPSKYNIKITINPELTYYFTKINVLNSINTVKTKM